ncbi:MAG: zinc ribbon domain-containing protein [Polyangiaceae bacterium]|nr:zinc ribbon domain-containing protein [Polyangiaceae bacterium]
MPTYEYACDACQHEFELVQSIKDDPITQCPKCKKPKARRMIGGTGFILKGGGWYSDLYSGPSNSKKSDSGASTPKKTGSDAA